MNHPFLLAVAAAVLVGGCAPDGPDTYAVDAPPATRGPLPTTEPVPDATGSDGTDGAAEPVDEVADTEPEAFAPTGETVDVRALDNTFRPETVEIVAGTEVRWVNGGRNDHDVLPVEDEEFRVERDSFRPGDEYSFVFDTPGVYPYYCSIHGTANAGMIGTIVVTTP